MTVAIRALTTLRIRRRCELHHSQQGSAAISSQMSDSIRLRSLLMAIAGESKIQSEVNTNVTSYSRHPAADECQKSPGSQSSHFLQQEENPQEEIKRLRTFLSDAIIKETSLLRENHRQEGQILELRSMIEKCQRDILHANSQLTLIQSEALEERARLIAERKAAQQDANVYATLLLPLLSEHNLQPASKDPHSIASGIKALVQHLQNERRSLVASRYLICDTPDLTPAVHDVDVREMVPHRKEVSYRGPASRSIANLRTPVTSNGPTYSTARFPRSEVHESPGENANVETGGILAPPHIREDPTFLVPNENDYLPGIKDLYVDGDAVIGNTICAYGFPINGTSLCHFQWVRHYLDGVSVYIPGAARPQYTIIADDVDTCISLLCTPMDNRQRKGDTIQVFVNNNNLITLGMDLEEQISKYLNNGEVSFRVEMQDSTEVFSEVAVLTIKQFTYEIKNMDTKESLAMGKYSSETKQVEIRVENDCQFSIINGGVHILKCEDNRKRDVVVLTMRRFIARASKGKSLLKNSFVSSS